MNGLKRHFLMKSRQISSTLGSFGNFRLVFTSTVLPSTSTQNEVSLVPGRS